MTKDLYDPVVAENAEKSKAIKIAIKMYKSKKDTSEILEFTELTEREFQEEVVDKVGKID